MAVRTAVVAKKEVASTQDTLRCPIAKRYQTNAVA